MPDSDIVVRMRAEDAGMIRKFLEGQEAIRALGRSSAKAKKDVEDLGNEGAKAGQKVKRGMNEAGQTINLTFGSMSAQMAKMVMQFAGFGSVMAGLYTTVRLIVAEYDRFKGLRNEAKTDVSSYAKGLANVELQMGDEEKISTIEPQIKRTLQDVGVRMEDVPQSLDMLAGMMSARGPMPSGRVVSPQETLKLWRRTSQVFARQGDWEGAKDVGEGLMDMYRASEGQDVDQLIGSAIEAFGLSRTTSMRKFGQNSLSGMAQLMKEGRIPASLAAGMVGQLGFEQNEGQGRISRRAALATVQKLDELAGASKLFNTDDIMKFKGLNAWQKVEWVAGEGKYSGAAEKTRSDRFRAYLLGARSPDRDDVRTAQLWDGHHGWTARGALQDEVRAESDIVSMLSKSDRLGARKGVREIDRLMKGVAPERARRRGAEFFAGQPGDENARFRKGEMAVEGAITGMKIGQLDRAWQGMAMQVADQLMDQVGTSAMGKKIKSIGAALSAGQYGSEDAVDMIAQQLDAAAMSILEETPAVGFGEWAGPQGIRRMDRGPLNRFRYEKATPANRQRLEIIRRAKQALRASNWMPEAGETKKHWYGTDESPLWETDIPEPKAAPEPGDQGRHTRALTDELAATRSAIGGMAAAIGRIPGNLVTVNIDDGGARAARRLQDRPLALRQLMG